MQEQLRVQQEKLDAKFQAEYQAAEDISLPLGYSDNFNEYDTKAWLCGVWVWALSSVLAVAAVVIFGGIAYLGVEQLQECEQPCKKEAFSALSLLPFILMGTLVLSPLAWVIRMLQPRQAQVLGVAGGCASESHSGKNHNKQPHPSQRIVGELV